jgi:ribA/ribD-fused uncharacterized protein
MIEEFKGKHRWLSNFAPAIVEHRGMVFMSVEAAYQSAKTTDLKAAARFTDMAPGEAKAAGRNLTIRPDWDDVKCSVMEHLLRQKFTNILDYKILLLGTEDQLIVEGNWWGDTFWGVCKGVGENHLGRLIMKIRSELQEED